MKASAMEAARTYVDFVPPHNLVEDADKQTLVVDLSAEGFKKEHLRVLIDNYGRLMISGERPLEGNRWSRFRKEIQVPDGCNAGDVRAKFEKDGVLHITIPRLAAVAEEPKAADDHNAAQDQKADDAGRHGTAQQSAAAEDEEEEHTGEKKGEAVSASAIRPGYDFAGARDRSKVVRTVVLALALAVVGAAAFYAKYRLMDPSA